MTANGALKPGNIATGVTTAASTNAVGTGPFKLESYKPDAGTTFVVNPDWWDKPQHNIDRIEFKPVKSDATRVAALLSGELDLIAPAPLQDLQRIGASSGFKVVEEPSLRLIMLSLNFRPELKAMPGQKNPMLDLKVRQAMWHAIDVDAIKKRVMRDKSRTTSTLVAPPVPGYSKDNDNPFGYDPEKAKKLLAKAGYPNGFKTKLNCPNDRYINDEQTCVAIAARCGPRSASRPSCRPSRGRPISRVRTEANSMSRWSAGRRCRRWTDSAFWPPCDRSRKVTAVPTPART